LRDWYARNLEKIDSKLHFVLYWPPAGMIGFEKRTIWEFLLYQRGLKNYFGTAAAEAAA
jgi:hypothetical protein